MGDTQSYRQGNVIEYSGLLGIIENLCRYFPEQHFVEEGKDIIASMHDKYWNISYRLAAPWGMGDTGTAFPIDACFIMMTFLKFQINQLVSSLLPEERSKANDFWDKNKFQI